MHLLKATSLGWIHFITGLVGFVNPLAGDRSAAHSALVGVLIAARNGLDFTSAAYSTSADELWSDHRMCNRSYRPGAFTCPVRSANPLKAPRCVVDVTRSLQQPGWHGGSVPSLGFPSSHVVKRSCATPGRGRVELLTGTPLELARRGAVGEDNRAAQEIGRAAIRSALTNVMAEPRIPAFAAWCRKL